MTTVAEFRIEYLRSVNPQGRPSGKLPAFANDDAELLKMFAAMLRARIFDAKAINLQRTGKLGTYAPCLGREAVRKLLESRGALDEAREQALKAEFTHEVELEPANRSTG